GEPEDRTGTLDGLVFGLLRGGHFAGRLAGSNQNRGLQARLLVCATRLDRLLRAADRRLREAHASTGPEVRRARKRPLVSVREWTFVLVGLSFLLYIGVAVWARAGTTRDFYVAGGQVPAAVNGMATAADWMSAASFISMAGLISFMGRDGAVYLMGWTGGYVLLALLLAPYLRKTSFISSSCGPI